MNIKKVDDKPMVIHTKKKQRFTWLRKKSEDKPKHKIKLASLAKARRVKMLIFLRALHIFHRKFEKLPFLLSNFIKEYLLAK